MNKVTRSGYSGGVVPLFGLILPLQAFGDIIQVPDDQPTIQSAIDAAGTGDEIIVAPATYLESINLLGKAITLRSSAGPERTIIDANNITAAIVCGSGETAATVIEGFTITNGQGGVGGGLAARQGSSPTIRNCIFTRNRAMSGGAVGCRQNSRPTFIQCIFYLNHAEGGSGGAFFNDISDPTIINCTLVDNQGNAGGIFNQFSSPTIINSIIRNNANPQIHDAGGGQSQVSFSNIQGFFPGAGNINAEPFFFDIGAGDLRIAVGSPGVDAGSDTAPNLPAFDLDGLPRIADGNDDGTPTVDMGTYEVQQRVNNITQGARFAFIQNAIDTADSGDVIEVSPGRSRESIDFLGKAITLRSTDGAGETVIDGTASDDSVVKCNNGEGPDTVLEGFMITKGDGHLVELARLGGGMYIENSSPTVRGCTFERNNANFGGGLYYINSDSVLESCIFRANLDIADGAGLFGDAGSPLISRCTFEFNRTATSNFNFGRGGGLLIEDGAPVIDGCIFGRNIAATNGAGLFIRRAEPLISNCGFYMNLAFGAGGGAHISGSVFDVTNCSFGNNTASQGAGLSTDIAVAVSTVRNSIFHANQPDQIFDKLAATAVTFSNVQGGVPGKGNIDAAPFFSDPAQGDLRLRPCSPCIDAGDNDSVPTGVVNDANGNPRFADDGNVIDAGNAGTSGPPIADMGAYERQEDSTSGTIHVPADQLSIQRAITAAGGCGDEIIVAPGQYRDAIDLLGKPLTLRSSDGPELTTIDAALFNDTAVKCVNGEGPGTVIDGFTITGGTGVPGDGTRAGPPTAHGGGMYNDGTSPTVRNCVFTLNEVGGDGGGMYNRNGHPTVEDCTFFANTAGRGGGMFNETADTLVQRCQFEANNASFGAGMSNLDGEPILEDSVFLANIASAGGGALQVNGQFTRVRRCRFLGNQALAFFGAGGGAVFNVAPFTEFTDCLFGGNHSNNVGGAVATFTSNNSVRIENSTLSGNSSTHGGGAIYDEAGTIFLQNSIVWDNLPDQILRGIGTSIHFNIIEDGFTSGFHNLDLNPQFVDADGADNTIGTLDDDFRLGTCSPGIDSGSSELVSSDSDLDGFPRRVDDTGVPDTGFGDAPIVDLGAYERQESTPSSLVTVPGDFPSIQAAIDSAPLCGREVVVIPGTYNETIDFLGKAVTVRSSAGPSLTTIDATGLGGSVAMFTNDERRGTVLKGFTITGGTGFPIVGTTFGGGILTVGSSPTIDDCVIYANKATFGGGICTATGAPLIKNATIINNIGATGGGVYNDESNPRYINSVIVRNEIDPNSTGDDGAGLFNINSHIVMINCTIAFNRTDIFPRESGFPVGGIKNVNSFTEALNSVLFSNTPFDLFDDEDSISIVRNSISDVEGNGNITASPRFVDANGADDIPGTPDDDFRLNRCSPGIDAGRNDIVPAEIVTDRLGDARFVDDGGTIDTGQGQSPIVDMGAFELQVESAIAVFEVSFPESIQEAVDFASCSGDEVVIGPGTYTERVSMAGRGITLRSAEGPWQTFVTTPPEDETSIFVHLRGSDTIRGLTMIGSTGRGMFISNASPIVDGCVFRLNELQGMFIQNGSPQITNCIFDGNGQSALEGGAIACGFQADATITNCRFTGNTASSSGGALYLRSDSHATVRDCVFLGNEAVQGGAIANVNASPVFDRCRFLSNTAFFGGAMYTTGDASIPAIFNSLFSGNEALVGVGGAIANDDGGGSVFGCTFSKNTVNGSGGAIHNLVRGGEFVDSGMSVFNSILWGNTPDQIFDDLENAFAGNRLHNNVEGGTAGLNGNISSDPLFVNPLGEDGKAGTEDDDLRLRSRSPSIDAGSNLFAEGGNDLDGNLRFIDDPDTPDCPQSSEFCGTAPITDMGALEFVPLFGDFDGNGIVNHEDFVAFVDCMNGPEEAPTPTPPTTPIQCADAFDFDGDLDVDLQNFWTIQRSLDQVE